VADLATRVRVGGITYLGDHGVERAVAPRGFRPASLSVEVSPAAAGEARLVSALADGVPRAVPEPWLVVERKSAAITFHYRSAPDLESARRRVRGAADAIDPSGLLARHQGRRALELRPAGASDKGLAMARLLVESAPDAVLMLGDDSHDVLAFDVLAEARHRGRVAGLAVAVAAHPEVTAVVSGHADLVLGSPAEAARLLSGLARMADLRVRRGGAARGHARGRGERRGDPRTDKGEAAAAAGARSWP
jgi:trehalose-phosphatase